MKYYDEETKRHLLNMPSGWSVSTGVEIVMGKISDKQSKFYQGFHLDYLHNKTLQRGIQLYTETSVQNRNADYNVKFPFFYKLKSHPYNKTSW